MFIKKLLYYFFLIFTWLAISSVMSAQVYADLYINEFSSDTEGTSDDPDWIEIYNNGSESIDLSNYFLRDSTTTNKKNLTGSISSNGFIVFEWFNKLNKDGDTIILVLNSDENIIDEVTYGSSNSEITSPGKNQSAGRLNDGSSEWVIFSIPTKNASNSTSNPIPTPTNTPIPTPTSEPSPTPTRTPTPTKIPTPTKTPTPIKTPTPVRTPTPTKSLRPTNTPTPIKSKITISPSQKKKNDSSSGSASILGESSRSSEFNSKIEKGESLVKDIKTSEQRKSNTFGILMSVGGILFVVCGILVYRKYKTGNDSKGFNE